MVRGLTTLNVWNRGFVDAFMSADPTASGFAAEVGRTFEIAGLQTSHRRFEVPVRKWLLPSSWKYLAGNLVVASTYVRAGKRD